MNSAPLFGRTIWIAALALMASAVHAESDAAEWIEVSRDQQLQVVADLTKQIRDENLLATADANLLAVRAGAAGDALACAGTAASTIDGELKTAKVRSKQVLDVAVAMSRGPGAPPTCRVRQEEVQRIADFADRLLSQIVNLTMAQKLGPVASPEDGQRCAALAADVVRDQLLPAMSPAAEILARTRRLLEVTCPPRE